jgi:hypothetical protein
MADGALARGSGFGIRDSGFEVETLIMITLQAIITLAYYALTAGAAALLLYNFVKAKAWEREVLYLIVLVPFLLRILRLK